MQPMLIRFVKIALCLSFALSGLGLGLPQQTQAQQAQAQAQQSSEPVVAKMEMKLTLGEQVLDTIDKGDLLTVLEVRDKSYLIRTFSGHTGAVANVTVSKLSEAGPIYDELIEKSPDEGRLYTLRASCYWAVGDAEKAIADFDRAIELGYDQAHAFSSRGLFHAAMRNYDQAIADYSEAIRRDPQDAVPLINRAAVHVSTGKYEAAVEDYSRAIELSADNPALYIQRAITLKLLGKLDAAVRDYDKAIELADRDISAWMGRGFLKFQQGEHAAAIDDFSHVIELSPESAVAINNRGYNYQMLTQEAAALADYSRAVELAPKYLLALQNRAWLLATAQDTRVKDPAQAIAAATTVCEISEYKDFSDLTLLAAAHAAAGEFETAIGWQEKSVERATAEQKPIADKLIALYQKQLPFDPKLLEAQPAPAAAQVAGIPEAAPVDNPTPDTATDSAPVNIP